MDLLDALGYAGSVLEKPGRAVRGLLTGNAREGLAALPFSDTTGLTDESEKVTGHDLLNHLGLDPGDGIGGTLAGIGADVATDPLTYMGGALAKRLLGGGFRTVGKGAADLVPEQFDIGNRYAQMAEGGFPGEVGKMPPMAQQIHELPVIDHPGPYTLPGADAPMPGGELIRELPHPRAYQDMIPISPRIGMKYDPAKFGLPGDAMLDANPHAAFDNLLAGWDQVLHDFGRLRPEAYHDLTGLPHPALSGPATEESILHAPLAGSGQAATRPDRSVVGDAWQGFMYHHSKDLAAASDLADALPADLVARARDQFARINPLLDWQAGTRSHDVVSDLLGGATMPSEAARVMRVNLPYLPADERGVRAIAAQNQKAATLDEMRKQLDYLTEGQVPVAALHGEGGLWDEPVLYRRLHNMFSPENYPGTEPGILAEMLGHPPDPQLQEARQLLGQLEPQLLQNHLANHAPHLAGNPDAERALLAFMRSQDPQSLSYEDRLLATLRPFGGVPEAPPRPHPGEAWTRL